MQKNGHIDSEETGQARIENNIEDGNFEPTTACSPKNGAILFVVNEIQEVPKFALLRLSHGDFIGIGSVDRRGIILDRHIFASTEGKINVKSKKKLITKNGKTGAERK